MVDSGDHGSILDGCVLAKAKVRSFRHNRLDRLKHTLKRAAHDRGGVLVVVDGVFSMEGDIAPLPEIADLCERFGARLMVDEAHAIGVFGARGAGVSELFGVEDRVDLRMATFSKALASCGGVIAGPADVIDYLRIHSRPFIFTASAVPAAIGAVLASVRDLPVGRGPPVVRPGPRQCALSTRRTSVARVPRRRTDEAARGDPRSSPRWCRSSSATRCRR